MDEDFAIRRGATIDMRRIEEMPGLIIPTRPEQWVITDACGRELIEQRMLVEANGHKFILTLILEPYDHNRLRMIHSYSRELEVRAGDSGFFRGLILGKERFNTAAGHEGSGYKVEFETSTGPIRTCLPEALMTFLEERPDPQIADTDDAPGGAKARGVLDAIAALWPDGIIPVISKERDNAVRVWLVEHGRSVPINIARAVQRALAASEETSHVKR
jgi:hypothetical protein